MVWRILLIRDSTVLVPFDYVALFELEEIKGTTIAAGGLRNFLNLFRAKKPWVWKIIYRVIVTTCHG